MATNNTTFSNLPISNEHDRPTEPFAPLWAKIEKPSTNEHISTTLDGEVELDAVRAKAEKQLQGSQELEDLRLSIASDSERQLRGEITDLNVELANAKQRAGIFETNSVENTGAAIHIQERSRLKRMLRLIYKSEPAFSEFETVGERKAKLTGIVGAITGDQKTLMEINGASAGF